MIRRNRILDKRRRLLAQSIASLAEQMNPNRPAEAPEPPPPAEAMQPREQYIPPLSIIFSQLNHTESC